MKTQTIPTRKPAYFAILPFVLAFTLLLLVLGLVAGQGSGDLVRITAASDGNRDSTRPSLNGDGTVIVFQSDSDFLGQGIPDDQDEIWLYDTRTMTFTRITVASDSDRDSSFPYLSADGTIIAFRSDSDFLGQGIPDDQKEVWLYDTGTMTYTRVTTASESGRSSSASSLSADGTVVAFHSDSDILGQGIPAGQNEIWLYDTATMSLSLIHI